VRSGAAAGHAGYFHETAFYGSDDEFVEDVVPFVEGGLAAGEPTLVACGPANTALLREAVSDPSGISFLPGAHQYARPGRTIKWYRELLAGYVARGATQVRVVGDVPHPGVGAGWDGWARYEATVNHAYDDFPVWGLCPYDTRITPSDVLDDVTRTHPHIATARGEHLPNARFEEPADFLVRRRPRGPDPLEAGPPVVDLVDPSPAAGRQAVRDACLVAGLDPAERDDLVLALSEVVTNAWCHGVAPVRMRAWIGVRRVVVAVTDGGSGPSDPFVGLLLPERSAAPGGLGLWVAHELCREVRLDRTGDGFTVRLVAGGAERAPGWPS
jgi:anti-sigma regulatory factor (Ser/Thr protein kinase)